MLTVSTYYKKVHKYLPASSKQSCQAFYVLLFQLSNTSTEVTKIIYIIAL